MQTGDVAIVTAGASGLGRVIAHELASRGFHVVIGDVDREAGRSTVEEIGSAGGDATVTVADVTDDEELSQLVDAASSAGPLRALVNNAGGWGFGGQYPQGSATEWSRVLDLNLRAPMLATQRRAPRCARSALQERC